MTVTEPITTGAAEAFTAAMGRLASALAVVTAARPDGAPCGLLVSSLCSYSVRPPSVLVSIDERTRSYPALLAATTFGVHLLGSWQGEIARAFASRRDDKFACLSWTWDGSVPRIADVPVYLACRLSEAVVHGDHAILIGEANRVDVAEGGPLVYYRKRYDWQLHAPANTPLLVASGPSGSPVVMSEGVMPDGPGDERACRSAAPLP